MPELDTAAGGWVVEGTWVTFSHPGFPEPAVGFVFAVTPCARAAILAPFDGWDEVVILDPADVHDVMRLDDVRNALEVLTPADINSITFDRAERQLRIDAVRTRENSHA
jgi:hypothetical protein